MLDKIRLIAALVAVLAIPSLVRADDGPWNSETFEYYASIIREQPATRPRIIKGCSEGGLSAIRDRLRAEFELDSGMPAEKAAVEVCRRFITGIASGAVKYETYRAWVETPDDKSVVIPDYK
jgi:hypothetical protein